MALTVRSNGSGSSNIIQASWWNDFYNLLTGAMQDQEVTIKNNLVLQLIGAAPSTAPSGSLVSSSTGLGVGAYVYTYTYVSPDGESTESPTFSITTTTGNQNVSLSGITTGPTGTTARNIYRTKVGATQRQYLTQLANNTATTYTDSTADTSLLANAPTNSSFGGSLIGKDQSGTIQFRIYNNGAFSAGGGGTLGNTTISGTLTVTGTSSLDNGNITTNGAGRMTSKGLTITANGLTITSGTTSLDNGALTTDGSGNVLTTGGKFGVSAAGDLLDASSTTTYLKSRGGGFVFQTPNGTQIRLLNSSGKFDAVATTGNITSGGNFTMNDGATFQRMHGFTGTGSVTANHQCGTTPNNIQITTGQASGSQTIGTNSWTTTQVTVTTGAGLAWTGLAIVY